MMSKVLTGMFSRAAPLLRARRSAVAKTVPEPPLALALISTG